MLQDSIRYLGRYKSMLEEMRTCNINLENLCVAIHYLHTVHLIAAETSTGNDG